MGLHFWLVIIKGGIVGGMIVLADFLIGTLALTIQNNFVPTLFRLDMASVNDLAERLFADITWWTMAIPELMLHPTAIAFPVLAIVYIIVQPNVELAPRKSPGERWRLSPYMIAIVPILSGAIYLLVSSGVPDIFTKMVPRLVYQIGRYGVFAYVIYMTYQADRYGDPLGMMEGADTPVNRAAGMLLGMVGLIRPGFSQQGQNHTATIVQMIVVVVTVFAILQGIRVGWESVMLFGQTWS